jgi:cobalamin biosynthetic protein CobC
MGQPISHGGGLIAARARFADAPEPWLDLSTGINPAPYPVQLPLEAFTRLPEPEAVARLEAVAAQAYGVTDPALVAAAPGTQSLIHLLPRLLPNRNVVILGPTYGEHAAAWALAGSRVRTVGTLAAVSEADIAVVCNPNNPDGALQSPAALLGLADRLGAAGGLLIVDEAYADLEECSLAATLPRPGLALLRSFGKTYGLAGLRLGFLLANAELVDRVREALGPWAVSGPAIAVAQGALADTAWRAATAARLAAQAARLDRLLQTAGCRVLGGTRLFRLVALGDAGGAYERLGRSGILVRRFDDHPRWLRFGLPPEEGWDRLQAARSALSGWPA